MPTGLTNYELTISSSDQGEEPVVDSYNLEIAVNRIADATNVFGLFYDNLTSDGVDVVSLYYHPDQDGSESLTVDLYVDDLLGSERISLETNGETNLENGLNLLENEADVLSNNITLNVNSSSTTNLAARFTAREDVEGYGDVKTGFEESVDETAVRLLSTQMIHLLLIMLDLMVMIYLLPLLEIIILMAGKGRIRLI